MLSATYNRLIALSAILRRLANERASRKKLGLLPLHRKSASSERITSASSNLYCGSRTSPKAICAPARALSRFTASHWCHRACGNAFSTAFIWLAKVGELLAPVKNLSPAPLEAFCAAIVQRLK